MRKIKLENVNQHAPTHPANSQHSKNPNTQCDLTLKPLHLLLLWFISRMLPESLTFKDGASRGDWVTGAHKA